MTKSNLTKAIVGGITLGLLVLLAITKLNNTQQEGYSPEKQISKNTIMDTPSLIEKEIRASVNEKTNTFRNKIKEIRVNTVYDNENEYVVFVSLNGEELVTEGAIEKMILIENSDIYITLFKNRKDIREATLVSNITMVDENGNEYDTVALKTNLSKDMAEKVDWGQDKSILELEILPVTWTTQKNIFKNDL